SGAEVRTSSRFRADRRQGMVGTGVRRTLGLAAGAVLVLALMPGSATAATATVVTSRENAELGPILVANRTVYTLQPGRTACTAACRHDWPPVELAHGLRTAQAGAGVDASQLGTAKAAKGRLQITYGGKRLYWSVKDKTPAAVHGNV